MSSQFENNESHSLINPSENASSEAETSRVDIETEKDDDCVIRKKRQKTSLVWNDFDEVDIPKVGIKAICKYCKDKFATGGKGSSTSHLKRHTNSCLQRKLHMNSIMKQPTIPFRSSTSIVNPFLVPGVRYSNEKMREIIATAIIDDDELFMKDMAFKMKLKFDKYWGECNLLMAIASVLDPRCKLHVVNICFPLIYKPSNVCKEQVDKVMNSLKMVYEEYVEMAKEESATNISGERDREDNSSISRDSNSSIVTGFDQIMSIVRTKEAVPPSQSELQTYLDEPVHNPEGNSSTFSALQWWKEKSSKFKILSRMAADILAIPISTVASESSFSLGRRVIDDYRSNLNEESIEALICGGDWLRNKYGLKKKKELEQELEIA